MSFSSQSWTTFLLGMLLALIATPAATLQAQGPPPPPPAAPASAFTETFDNGIADWADAGSFPLTPVASGGPDGSAFVSTDVSFAALSGGAGGSTAVLFRAQDEFGLNGSSDGAFEGDYIAGGINRVSALVRHNASEPLNFFYRGSTIFNFPAIVISSSTPVAPNVWTEIAFDLTPTNPDVFVEAIPGTSFNDIVSGIGHLQLGISLPDGSDTDTTLLTFDLDQASISVIPEPSTLALASMALLVGIRRGTR